MVSNIWLWVAFIHMKPHICPFNVSEMLTSIYYVRFLILIWLTMKITQNHWASGLCPSSGVLNNYKKQRFRSWSCSCRQVRGGRHLLSWVYCKELVSVQRLQCGRWPESRKTVVLSAVQHRQDPLQFINTAVVWDDVSEEHTASISRVAKWDQQTESRRTIIIYSPFIFVSLLLWGRS
jgi:hypothetical protein